MSELPLHQSPWMKRSLSDPSPQLSLDLPPAEEAALEHFSQPRKRAPRKTGAAAPFDPEAVATALEASPDFRVLRRLKAREIYSTDTAAREVTAAFVDCETEGLGPEDKIVEIGIVRFVYDADTGKVLRLVAPVAGYSAFEDPGRPLSAEIRRLTGIEDADLAGQRFEDEAVNALLADVQLVIAHNAGFDRPRFEKRFPFLATKPWGCSFKDVDWSAHGVSSGKLEFLGFVFGFFFDGHRAVNDCFASLEVLSKPMPDSGQSVMHYLLEGSRRETWRHFVNPARFQNDRFRALGYRWCGKERAASWYKDYADRDSAEAAGQIITKEGIGVAQVFRRITARDRYSAREMQDA